MRLIQGFFHGTSPATKHDDMAINGQCTAGWPFVRRRASRRRFPLPCFYLTSYIYIPRCHRWQDTTAPWCCSLSELGLKMWGCAPFWTWTAEKLQGKSTSGSRQMPVWVPGMRNVIRYCTYCAKHCMYVSYFRNYSISWNCSVVSEILLINGIDNLAMGWIVQLLVKIRLFCESLQVYNN